MRRTQYSVLRNGVCVFRQSGHSGRAEIDDLHRAGFVYHDIVWPEILVQHFHAVKGAQAFGDLFDNAAYRLDIRFWIVDHPLRQCLAFDKFCDNIQVIAFSGWQEGLQYMRIIEASRDPFFH